MLVTEIGWCNFEQNVATVEVLCICLLSGHVLPTSGMSSSYLNERPRLDLIPID